MSGFQGQDWVNLMTSYETGFAPSEQVETELSSLFFKIGKTLEKKSSLCWLIRAFDKYIDSNIISIGLRVQIFPNVDHVSTDCKKEWGGQTKCLY